MKKTFLLLTMMGIALTGFSQEVLSSKDALKQVAQKKVATGFELLPKNDFAPTRSVVAIDDATTATIVTGLTYDWQSNSGLLNRIYAWEDGTVGSAWTHSREQTFADRGTGYNYFNGSAWTQDSATSKRVENERTGFGTYAPWGDKGEVTVAHAGAGYLVISMRETKGEGDWTYLKLDPPSGISILWPSVWTSGDHREYIHIITNTNDGVYEGQKATVLYSRYNSLTKEWEDKNHLFDEWNKTKYPKIGANSYCFLKTTDKKIVAFSISDAWTDGFVMLSKDNGKSWEQIMFYKHPNPMGNFDSLFFYPRYTSGAFDSKGKLHIAFEFNASIKESATEPSSYYPGLGGIIYWNQDMPVRDTGYISKVYSTTWIYKEAAGVDMPNEYVGYFLCINPETGELVPMSEVLPVNFDNPVWYPKFCGDNKPNNHGEYNSGPICMPEIMIDKTDNIYVIWAGVADGYCYDNSLNYYRIFGRASNDGGATWGEPKLFTKGFTMIYKECVYPYLAPRLVNGKVCITFQMDDFPGTFVMGKQTEANSEMINIMADFKTNIAENNYKEVALNLSPNPASSQVILNVEGVAHISIYNMIGQLVRNIGNVTNEAVIDVTNFTSGIYLITASQNGNITTKKLIVQ